ncbi:hypothetical protein WJX81_000835 [Elliptochloris bilobata]|uniref:glycerophosphodiester phosphodiesterase n=1 Tax=Elliptochloris bilobata TaxID=381761 RepID=A0AAW1QY49_9CHLO
MLPLRLTGALVMSALLTIRAARLYLRPSLAAAVWTALLALAAGRWGLGRIAAASVAAWAFATARELLRQPLAVPNVGHRAGAHGFAGRHCENTLEALADLVERDRAGLAPGLAYVEFDVHETADGELVVLHDLPSLLAASLGAPANAAAAEALHAAGIDARTACAHDLSLAQLQAVKVGGREGVCVPTLEQLLGCCEQEGLERTVAVEIKSLRTGAARERFIALVSGYRASAHCAALERRCPQRQYAPFGWAAAIAFPGAWGRAFGPLGSREWRRWALRCRDSGLPARSCVLHSLDLLQGAG